MVQRDRRADDTLTQSRAIQVTRRQLLQRMSLAAGAALLAACGPPAAPAPVAPAAPTQAPAQPAAAAKPSGNTRPDELVLCWGTYQLQTHQLDPQTHVGTIAESQLRHIFDPAVQTDRDLQTIKPQLATEWRRLDDLTIQFKLRKGVKFHNGEDFDAEGARFSVLRPIDPANKADARTTYAGISDVEVVD